MRKLLTAFLFFVSLMGLASAQSTFKVLSYNVEDGFHHGDAEHVEAFINWVKPKDPDVVFFQEMNDFTAAKLADLGKAYGHPYSVLSKTTGYPVAMTSKYPITNVKIMSDPMTHGYIRAKVHGYDVLVTHLNPHEQRKRAEEILLVLQEISKLPRTSKLILAGDFNSMNAHDGAHITEAEILKLQEKERENPNLRNLVNGQPDFSITGVVEKGGLVDAYLLNRGEGDPGYEKNHPSIGHRIDYIWVSPALRDNVLSCSFIYDEVTAHLSDHHPLWMELKE